MDYLKQIPLEERPLLAVKSGRSGFYVVRSLDCPPLSTSRQGRGLQSGDQPYNPSESTMLFKTEKYEEQKWLIFYWQRTTGTSELS